MAYDLFTGPQLDEETERLRRLDAARKSGAALQAKTTAFTNKAADVFFNELSPEAMGEEQINTLFANNEEFQQLVKALAPTKEDAKRVLKEFAVGQTERWRSYNEEERAKGLELLRKGFAEGVHAPSIAWHLQQEQIDAVRNKEAYMPTPWQEELQRSLSGSPKLESGEDLMEALKGTSKESPSIPVEVGKFIARDLPYMLAGPEYAKQRPPEQDERYKEAADYVARAKSGIPSYLSDLGTIVTTPARGAEGFLTGAGRALQAKHKGEAEAQIQRTEALGEKPSAGYHGVTIPALPKAVKKQNVGGVKPSFEDFLDPDIWRAALEGARVHGVENPDSLYNYRQYFYDLRRRNEKLAIDMVLQENGMDASFMPQEELERIYKANSEVFLEKANDLTRADVLGWAEKDPEWAQLLGSIGLDPLNFLAPATVLKAPAKGLKVAGKVTAKGIRKIPKAGPMLDRAAGAITDIELGAKTMVKHGGEFEPFVKTMGDEGQHLVDELLMHRDRGLGASDLRLEMVTRAERAGFGVGPKRRERLSDYMKGREGSTMPEGLDRRAKSLQEVIDESGQLRLSEELRPAHRTVEGGEIMAPTTLENYGHSEILRADADLNIHLQQKIDELLGTTVTVNGELRTLNSAEDVALAFKQGAKLKGLNKGDARALKNYGIKVAQQRRQYAKTAGASSDLARKKQTGYQKDPFKQEMASQKGLGRAEAQALETVGIHKSLKERDLVFATSKEKSEEAAILLQKYFKTRYKEDMPFQVLDPARSKRYLTFVGEEGDIIAKQSVILPEPIIKRMDEIFPVSAKVYDSASMETFSRAMLSVRDVFWRPAMGLWRTSATVASVGFNIATNIPGAFQMGTVAMGLKSLNPIHQAEAVGAPLFAYLANKRGIFQALPGAGKIADLADTALKLEILTPDGVTTLGEVYKLAEKHGKVGVGSMRYGLEMKGRGPIALIDALVRGATEVTGLAPMARLTDDYQRFNVFLGLVKQHGTSKKVLPHILRETDKLAANYRALSQFEKTFPREIFGFYNWNKFAIGWGVRGLLKNPERFGVYLKIMNYYNQKGDVEDRGGFPPAIPDKAGLADSLKRQSSFRGGPEIYKELEGIMAYGDYIQGRMEHPLSTVEQLYSDVGKFAGDNLALPPKIVFGLVTGYDPETGEAIPGAMEWMKTSAFKAVERPMKTYGLLYKDLMANGMVFEAMDVLHRAGIVARYAPERLSAEDRLKLGSETGGLRGVGKPFTRHYLRNFMKDVNIQKDETQELMRALEKAQDYRNITR